MPAKRGEQILAAKPHTCTWCSEQIEARTYYFFRSVNRGGGRYERHRMHPECHSHYVRTNQDTYVMFVNKRDGAELVTQEEETGFAFTVFVHRSAILKADRDEKRQQAVAADVFVCRVYASSTSMASSKAVKQAFAYDLAVWNADNKHLLRQLPQLKHYQSIQTLSGFPSLIRPE